MKLYDLAEEVRMLADRLEESDIDQQTILDTIEGSTEMMSFEEKADGIIRMAKNWESELPGIEAEIARLQALKKSIEGRTTSVKSYLKLCMERAGIKEAKIGTFKAKLQRNSRGSIIIENEKSIPAAYIDIVPEQKVANKERLYEVLKTGKEVAGVKYEVGNHLRIS